MYNVLYNVTLSDNRVLNSASLGKSLINSLGFALVWTELSLMSFILSLCVSKDCVTNIYSNGLES